MVDVEFVEQLVDSMNESVLQMEKAISEDDKDKANKLKVFIFDLHNQISTILGEKNV